MTTLATARRWRHRIAAIGVLSLLAATSGFSAPWSIVPDANASAARSEARGGIHALVIGIDEYRYPTTDLSRLNGAVRDAQDVAAAIRELGGEVTLLTDGAATRDAIESGWQAVVDAAPRGATVFLVFVGHGGQEPERIPGLETDGKSETSLLAGFTTRTREGTRERIFDHEWKAWIRKAEGRNVITFFDACHSGTPTRSFRGVSPWPSRSASYPAIDASADGLDFGAIPLLDLKVSEENPVEPFETSIGGALDGQLVYERPFDGVIRGAASVYFARALRGYADTDRDGQLTRKELRTYMVANVAQATAGRQQATVAIHDSVALDAPLLRVPKAAAPPAGAPVRYAVEGMAAADRQALARSIPAAELVSSGQATLLWQVARCTVVNLEQGDEVADGICTSGDFQNVVSKWVAVRQIQRLMEARPIDVEIGGGARRFIKGQEALISADEVPYPHVIAVNLAPTGKVQVLKGEAPVRCRPRCADSSANPSGSGFQQPAWASEPFGADHLVLVATQEHPEELWAELSRLDGLPRADFFLAALREQVKRGPTAIGMVAFYTAAQ